MEFFITNPYRNEIPPRRGYFRRRLGRHRRNSRRVRRRKVRLSGSPGCVQEMEQVSRHGNLSILHRILRPYHLRVRRTQSLVL